MSRGEHACTAVHWDILKQDLRYTARTLNRARGFALTAILLTALGVGANTAAFSVADFVLLRPLPFADPDALVRACEGPRTGGGWGCMNEFSPANYRDVKAMSSSFEAMGAFTGGAANLVGIGEPRRLTTTRLTPEVLPLLGVAPALGRVFDAREDDRRAAVISHGLWQAQFGGDASVLGRTVHLDGVPHTIVGVMPRGFYFPNREVQLWTALTFQDADYEDRTNTYIQAVARLKHGVTFEQALADLEVIAARLARDYPSTNAETGISFFRMRENMSPRFRLMLVALGPSPPNRARPARGDVRGAVHGAHGTRLRSLSGDSCRPADSIRRAARRRARGGRSEAAPPRRPGHGRSHDVGDPADRVGTPDQGGLAGAGHRPGLQARERAGDQHGAAAAQVRQAVAARPVPRWRPRAGAGAARRAERGVHQRTADGHHGPRHRGGHPWPRSAARPAGGRQPSLGHAAVFQNDGDPVAARRACSAPTLPRAPCARCSSASHPAIPRPSPQPSASRC